MKIIYNRYFPFKGYKAINLFGIVFARQDQAPLTPTWINHMKIHTAQMRELLFIGFYIIYMIEYIYQIIHQNWTGQNAHRCISFEREAHKKQNKWSYLSNRKPFAQWRK